jgi:hypothetical protein
VKHTGHHVVKRQLLSFSNVFGSKQSDPRKTGIKIVDPYTIYSQIRITLQSKQTYSKLISRHSVLYVLSTSYKTKCHICIVIPWFHLSCLRKMAQINQMAEHDPKHYCPRMQPDQLRRSPSVSSSILLDCSPDSEG